VSAPAAASSFPFSPRALARYATVLCAFAVAAAVVSFVKGSWLGVIWVLLAGLASNMAWYYGRRARQVRTAQAQAQAQAGAQTGTGGAAGAAQGSTAAE